MLREFRESAIRGNFVDLVTGVIIGTAFGAIVSSLVDDVFMPMVGLIPAHIHPSELFIVVSNPNSVPVASLQAVTDESAAALNIGLFTNAVVEFTIVAFVLFLVVKGINAIRKKQAAALPA